MYTRPNKIGLEVPLARACGRVPRKRCRTTLLAPETARPLSSCITTGPGGEREAHRHAIAVHRSFFPTVQSRPYRLQSNLKLSLNRVARGVLVLFCIYSEYSTAEQLIECYLVVQL